MTEKSSSATPSPAFVWRDKPRVTIGDLTDAMEECTTVEEAREFMSAYRTFTPHADVNIGYLTGYYGHTEAARLRDWFQVEHPIFGKTTPTVEQALEAGKRAATGEFDA